jgi:hypothetical protein
MSFGCDLTSAARCDLMMRVGLLNADAGVQCDAAIGRALHCYTCRCQGEAQRLPRATPAWQHSRASLPPQPQPQLCVPICHAAPHAGPHPTLAPHHVCRAPALPSQLRKRHTRNCTELNRFQVRSMAHYSWPNLRNDTPCMLPLSTKRG